MVTIIMVFKQWCASKCLMTLSPGWEKVIFVMFADLHNLNITIIIYFKLPAQTGAERRAQLFRAAPASCYHCPSSNHLLSVVSHLLSLFSAFIIYIYILNTYSSVEFCFLYIIGIILSVFCSIICICISSELSGVTSLIIFVAMQRASVQLCLSSLGHVDCFPPRLLNIIMNILWDLYFRLISLHSRIRGSSTSMDDAEAF